MRRFVKVVINFQNDRIFFYLQLIKNLKIKIFEHTIRNVFRKIDFRRYIACFKFLIF